jgi:hypothetical protein
MAREAIVLNPHIKQSMERVLFEGDNPLVRSERLAHLFLDEKKPMVRTLQKYTQYTLEAARSVSAMTGKSPYEVSRNANDRQQMEWFIWSRYGVAPQLTPHITEVGINLIATIASEVENDTHFDPANATLAEEQAWKGFVPNSVSQDDPIHYFNHLANYIGKSLKHLSRGREFSQQDAKTTQPNPSPHIERLKETSPSTVAFQDKNFWERFSHNLPESLLPPQKEAIVEIMMNFMDHPETQTTAKQQLAQIGVSWEDMQVVARKTITIRAQQRVQKNREIKKARQDILASYKDFIQKHGYTAQQVTEALFLLYGKENLSDIERGEFLVLLRAFKLLSNNVQQQHENFFISNEKIKSPSPHANVYATHLSHGLQKIQQILPTIHTPTTSIDNVIKKGESYLSPHPIEIPAKITDALTQLHNLFTPLVRALQLEPDTTQWIYPQTDEQKKLFSEGLPLLYFIPPEEQQIIKILARDPHAYPNSFKKLLSETFGNNVSVADEIKLNKTIKYILFRVKTYQENLHLKQLPALENKFREYINNADHFPFIGSSKFHKILMRYLATHRLTRNDIRQLLDKNQIQGISKNPLEVFRQVLDFYNASESNVAEFYSQTRQNINDGFERSNFSISALFTSLEKVQKYLTNTQSYFDTRVFLLQFFQSFHNSLLAQHNETPVITTDHVKKAYKLFLSHQHGVDQEKLQTVQNDLKNSRSTESLYQLVKQTKSPVEQLLIYLELFSQKDMFLPQARRRGVPASM